MATDSMDQDQGEVTYAAWTVSGTVVAAVVIAMFYWVWCQLGPKYPDVNIPPFPAQKRSLIGHLFLWAGREPIDTLKVFREKAGDLFSIDVFGNLIVVVNGYEAIKEVAIKHGAEVSDRPSFVWTSYLNEDNHGILDGKGENWKEQRATSLSILRSFGLGKNALAEKISEEVSIYTARLASFEGQPFDIYVPTSVAVSNIICSIIVGKRFSHDDPNFLRLVENTSYFFQNGPISLIALPFLRKIPGDLFGMNKFLEKMSDVNENFCKTNIEKVKKAFDEDETPASFISTYLEKMHQALEQGTPTHLDERNLIAIIREFFLAGSDTTSTTIYWCILYCLHYPEKQDKAFTEISAHVGSERLPNMNDRSKLSYVEALIKETQRCASLVPLALRKATSSFKVLGYTIPKDTTVILNVDSALQDREFWVDPDTFRPERFLDADGNLAVPDDHIPFGLGRRICVGEALAKMELFLFISAILQRFRIIPDGSSTKLPPLKGKLGMINKPVPFKMRLEARQQL